MYRIDVDKQQAIIELVLEGLIRPDEMTKFVEELKAATLGLAGRDIKIRADMRTFRPSSPEVAEMLRDVQEFGLRNGVKRVAELVESQLAALQLNRVARESGVDKILRRFTDDPPARRWLIHGDEESLSV
ncbi:STAS/SEC14 domain-containing protein [Archangium sp.]|uniref:STAS/SEC14 domain-containing protein n=1 Tax=Archangium sp. TaxID=1872627 RepID=UPI002D70A99C|nr:STAS/SEC14 domain-containing protein [Archangium sp.]HYO52396.1 STAS/SEC14 domain-containing protein [Archangium sp.]